MFAVPDISIEYPSYTEKYSVCPDGRRTPLPVFSPLYCQSRQSLTAVIRTMRLAPDGSVPSVMSWEIPIGITGTGLRFLSKGMILFILLWFYRYGNVTAISIGPPDTPVSSTNNEIEDSELENDIFLISPFSVAKTKFPV